MVFTNSPSRNLSKTIAFTSKPDVNDLLQLLDIPYIESDWTLRDLTASHLRRETSMAPGPWHQIYVIVVNSIAEARQILPLLTVEGVAKELVFMIKYWGSGLALEHANIPRTAVDQVLTVTNLRGAHRYRAIRLTGNAWQDINKFAFEIAGCSHNDLRKLPLSGVRLGVHDFESSSWAVGDGLARWVALDSDQSVVPVVDSVDIHAGSLRTHSQDSAEDIHYLLPPVDSVIFSPTGFDVYPKNGEASLTRVSGSRNSWQLVSDRKPIGAEFYSLDENILAEVRSFEHINIDGVDVEDHWSLARILTQLAMAGVPLKVSNLNQNVGELLGTELTGALCGEIVKQDDASARESYSIDLRRSVMKQFLPRLRISDLGIGGSRCVYKTPDVSIILATRRRKLIPQILEQIERQSYSNLEIILAIHGDPTTSDDVELAINSYGGRLVRLYCESSLPFGMVLNRASEVASGQLLTKMDDDDWYSPSHIEDLVLAREYSGAELVGAPVEFSYLEGLDITTRRSHGGERFTDHVAGGTMMLSKNDLRQVGGWRPVSNSVDRGLIDSMLVAGAMVYRTHGQNYVLHRRPSASKDQAHTWDAHESVFLRDVEEQWNGLVLPAQFGSRVTGAGLFERSDEFLSIFSSC
ncbi:glycosyltransferase [Arthrobacter alpinus]|uniref:glycosyltransferase family 2 protein n=1 Tax=Arthrobacter alpinus TaxID=656366 RepID=UPI001645CB01|nr:glycosyltransferase [Arthrobacter alpinus]